MQFNRMDGKLVVSCSVSPAVDIVSILVVLLSLPIINTLANLVIHVFLNAGSILLAADMILLHPILVVVVVYLFKHRS